MVCGNYSYLDVATPLLIHKRRHLRLQRQRKRPFSATGTTDERFPDRYSSEAIHQRLRIQLIIREYSDVFFLPYKQFSFN